ncbi:MAG: hypothetical protein ACM3PY_21655, partial [Omnitrophica WOR_2 bacterium]
MSSKKFIYILILALVAGISSLAGAFAGGFAVYSVVNTNKSTQVASVPTLAPASANPGNTQLTVDTTNVENAITEA